MKTKKSKSQKLKWGKLVRVTMIALLIGLTIGFPYVMVPFWFLVLGAKRLNRRLSESKKSNVVAILKF